MEAAPYVKIIEQPARGIRFRYECEGRSTGCIPGESNTTYRKTYPTIEIRNYVGPAIVVVSCVTVDKPHRPHPHKIVGKECCKDGICSMELLITPNNSTVSFHTIGVRCVKRIDVKQAMELKKRTKVNPYKTTVDDDPNDFDLTSVRLCFEVYVRDLANKKWCQLCPVVSLPITDKKTAVDLSIVKLSHCRAPIKGGMEMILLCDKVSKDDINVRFFEERNGVVTWEGYGEFLPSSVYRQVAISLTTPAYEKDAKKPVQVSVQLIRPSDNSSSEPVPFELVPSWEEEMLERKRQRNNNSSTQMLESIQAEAKRQHRESSRNNNNNNPAVKPDNLTAARTCQRPPILTPFNHQKSSSGLPLSNVTNTSNNNNNQQQNLRKLSSPPPPNFTVTPNFGIVPYQSSFMHHHNPFAYNIAMGQQQQIQQQQQYQSNVIGQYNQVHQQYEEQLNNNVNNTSLKDLTEIEQLLGSFSNSCSMNEIVVGDESDKFEMTDSFLKYDRNNKYQ